MITQLFILIAGFFILIKGADIFVDGASSTASNFKVSKMVIGLTIVAFGTSAPEFAISMKSLMAGSGEMVFGNVVGSNIINTLLILGVSSVITPLIIKTNTVRKELPIFLLISTLLVILFSDTLLVGEINKISRSDGLVIILFFTVFVYYLFSIMRHKIDDKSEAPQFSLLKSILLTILGIAMIIVGSELAVESATKMGSILGVSDRIIALTVIAIGTSLPELVTSIVAALKKEQDIVIGNIIGSNIFNICIVLGIPVSIFGGISPTGFSGVDLVIFLISALVLFIFSFTDHRITRKEGIMMLILFVIYYGYVIVGGTL